MKLKPLNPEIDELRKIIISSNLTSCYILLEELLAAKGSGSFSINSGLAGSTSSRMSMTMWTR